VLHRTGLLNIRKYYLFAVLAGRLQGCEREHGISHIRPRDLDAHLFAELVDLLYTAPDAA